MTNKNPPMKFNSYRASCTHVLVGLLNFAFLLFPYCLWVCVVTITTWLVFVTQSVFFLDEWNFQLTWSWSYFFAVFLAIIIKIISMIERCSWWRYKVNGPMLNKFDNVLGCSCCTWAKYVILLTTKQVRHNWEWYSYLLLHLQQQVGIQCDLKLTIQKMAEEKHCSSL